MKLKKTILILILFTCLIFSIAGACAGDADGTGMNATDTDERLASIDDNQVIKENSDDTLGATSTFRSLYDEIDHASAGSTITLNNDYAYSNGDPEISITKKIIINGNGKSLDGKGKTAILNIYSTVEINDLTIKNGKDDSYAPIYIGKGYKLTLKNCIIESNTGKRGAILNNEGELILTGCTIRDNSGNSSGAIYNSGTGQATLTNTIIERNTATQYNGAIYNAGKLTMTGGAISDNSGINGGAIFNTNTSELTLENARIENNNATDYGGGIYNEGIMTITNSEFINDRATKFGGAIFNFGNQETTITGSALKDNRASRGGAILAYTGNIRIDKSNITGNIASYGGAIENYVTLKITESRLENNGANSGGAIYNFNTLTIDNTYIGGNIAIDNGGAIYCNDESNTATITYSTMENNNAGDSGGAIFTKKTLIIQHSTFTNNLAKEGGAISNEGTLTITDSSLKNNNATSVGGAISTVEGKTTISDTSMENNHANNGGALYISNGDATVTSGTLKSNAATQYGGAIYTINSILKITGTGLTDNSAENGGAILCVNTTTTVTGLTLENNAATEYGGAIYVHSGSLTITGTTIKNNNAKNGGAIGNIVATTKITGSTLENNAATGIGGSILNRGKLTIENDAFKNNHATMGGAIANSIDGDSTVTGSNFTDNNGRYGGAIFNTEKITVTLSNFITNQAEQGGAIYNFNNTLKITDSSFERNAAENAGGAIYNVEGTFTTKNTKFEENIAQLIGAIYTENAASATIEEGTRFIDNTNNAPPVYAEKGTVDMSKAEIITTISFEIGHIDNFMKGSGTTLNVVVKMKSNNTVKGDVAVMIGDERFLVPLENGTGSLYITPSLNPGVYKARINFTQEYYIPTTAESNEFSIMDPNSFGGLDHAIKNAGDSISLTDDYAFDSVADGDFKNGIVISKNLTIYGNGKTIDGKGLAKAFYVNANVHLTIINLNIINCKSYGGGAIENRGNLTITDSTLSNNSVIDGSGGGAILTYRGSLTLNNCKLTDNIVKGRECGGGAILSSETITTLSNCLFENNRVIGYGNNGNYGGAIYNAYGTLSIDNCQIVNNSASGVFTIYGGGVYCNKGTMTITDTLIENNRVEGTGYGLGGGISTINSGNNVTIKNTKINNNSVTGSAASGGAIYNTDEFRIINSTIENNSANGDTGYGGAIRNSGKLTMIDTALSNNSANNYGGAVYNNGEVKILSCELNNNRANETGGAITNYGTLNMTDSTIKDNSAENASAIWTNNGDDVTLNNDTFVDNGKDDNSIYSMNGEVNTTDSKFMTSPEFEISNISDFLNGTSFTITVTESKLGDKFSGTVVVSIGFDKYFIVLLNGSGSKFVTPNAGPGKQTAKLTFEQTGDYYSSSAESNPFQVTIKPDIKIMDIADFEEDASVAIQITANRYFTDDVNVTINGVNYTVRVTDGFATATITPKLQRGSYKATITYPGNENYTADTAQSNNFTVTLKSVKITSQDVATVYNGGKYLVVSLTDIRGNAMVGVDVSIELSNGKKATLTTDKNGQVKFSTDKLAPKTYSATITFKGNDNYAKSTATAKITVGKATPKLTAKKKTFKRSAKSKKYSVTLKTNQNKALSKAKVTLKVNGKKYTAKTNAKGNAVFKLKLNKKGTFKSAVTYKGNAYYTKVSKKVKIVVK